MWKKWITALVNALFFNISYVWRTFGAVLEVYFRLTVLYKSVKKVECNAEIFELIDEKILQFGEFECL